MNTYSDNTRGVRVDALVGSLGVDIGSLFVKLVWQQPDGAWTTGSREHQGRPIAALRALLTESDVPQALPIGVTGPLAAVVTDQGVGTAVDPIRATIRGVVDHVPGVRNILDVGGGSLARITIDEAGQLLDYSSNSLCAAGTGSFLDEQARRLGLTLDQISTFSGLKDPPAIATRCAVFAKSDLIHRQQEGYGPDAMWSGLCKGLVGTMLQTLCGGRPLRGATLMVGGVSRNPEVQRWLMERLGSDFRHFADAHMLPAVGAARIAADELAEASSWIDLHEAKLDSGDSHRRPLLQLNRSKYPSMVVLEEYLDDSGTEVRRHVDLPHGTIQVALGIDIGSTSTKAVLVDRDGQVLADLYNRTSGDPIGATKRLFIAIGDLGRANAVEFEVIAAATTGSGRKLVGQVIGADLAVNEISAHVRGAQQTDPEVETIFEIGGQDAKFMDVRGGFLRDVNMNYVCAAGTGSFVEEQALKLGFPVQTVGAVTEGIAPPVTSDRCTVFMEQDVHRLLRQGFSAEEVMAAVMYSVVQNYLNRVVGNRRRSDSKIAFQGATARNRGLVAAFENLLGVEVVVSPLCHQMGAYGAALLGVQRLEADGWPTSTFRGLDLAKREVTLERSTCELCNNVCTITTATIEGDPEAPSWGYLCGRDPEETRMKRPDGIQYLEARTKAFNRTRGPKVPKDAPLVGIPRALGTWDLAPLWRTLLQGLGCRVKLSSRSDADISAVGIEMSGSDYCYPMKLAHGHAAKLLQDPKVDYVFMPFVIGDSYDPEEVTAAHYCPLNIAQTASIRSACSGLAIDTNHLLAPAVELQWSDKRITDELFKIVGPALGVDRKTVFEAWVLARRALADFREECQDIGRRALADLRENDGQAIVLLGRGYNLYDEGLNVSLPRKMAEQGWTVLATDLMPMEGDTLGSGMQNMFWWSGRRMLESARFVRDDPRLHAVCFTNFACGPDSFVLTYLEEVMGEQPYLTLELDEHGADGGYLTRIEAFVDVLGQERSAPAAPAPIRPPAGPFARLGNRTLWLPPMNEFGSRLMAATFRSFGIDARALPPETERSFERGKSLCRGTECLPAPATLGTLIATLEALGEDPRNHALFMPTARGPCRFGQYNMLQRLALDRIGMDEVFIVSPGSDDTYAEVGKGNQLELFRTIVISDVMLKALLKLRPYEVHPGQVHEVVEDGIRDLEHAMAAGRPTQGILKRVARRLRKVPVAGAPKPLVGIVGEIYVRSNSFCNQDVIGAIERGGGEAWQAPISEWILYTANCQQRQAGEDRAAMGWAGAWFKNKLLGRIEHQVLEPFNGILDDRHEPPVEEVVAIGAKHVPEQFEGETIITIGRAVRFLEDGAAMVVNCAPFTCMPGALTAGVFRQVQDEMNKPVISLFYDGTGDVNRRVVMTLRNLGVEAGSRPVARPSPEPASPETEPRAKVRLGLN